MSPRAACRLETLGVEHVYDYVLGKADWLARGLPRHGAKAGEPRAVDFARSDAVTCRLTDSIGDVRGRVQASAYAFALVLGDDGVLLGRLRKTTLETDAAAHVETVMEPGPSTVRADADPRRLRQRLDRQRLTTAVITDPDGRLLGIVRRDELPAA